MCTRPAPDLKSQQLRSSRHDCHNSLKVCHLTGWLAGWLAVELGQACSSAGVLGRDSRLGPGWLCSGAVYEIFSLYLLLLTFSYTWPAQLPAACPHCCWRYKFWRYTHRCARVGVCVCERDSEWLLLLTISLLGATQSGNACLISTFSSKNVLIYKRARKYAMPFLCVPLLQQSRWECACVCASTLVFYVARETCQPDFSCYASSLMNLSRVGIPLHIRPVCSCQARTRGN